MVYDDPEPGAWADPAPERPVPFRASVRLDLAAYREYGRQLGSPGGSPAVALGSAGFHAVLLYRIAHATRRVARPVGAILAGFLFWLSRHLYFCSIASTARLHGGLILPYPQGIVIGPGSVVGPGGWIEQNVTFGGTAGKVGLPRVGAGVRIACGAVLIGPVAVGDGSRIGPYAVVAADVPARSAVDGSPPESRPLPRRPPADPG